MLIAEKLTAPQGDSPFARAYINNYPPRLGRLTIDKVTGVGTIRIRGFRAEVDENHKSFLVYKKDLEERSHKNPLLNWILGPKRSPFHTLYLTAGRGIDEKNKTVEKPVTLEGVRLEAY